MPDKETPEVDDLLLRLEQKQAECARDYEAARAELARSHAEGEAEEARLVKQMEAMGSVVDRVLAQEDSAVSSEDERTCERYLKAAQMLHECRQARRLAYAATVAPGEQPLGSAIGDTT